MQHWVIDPGFRADLGFMGQVGYAKSVAGGSYTLYRDGKSVNRINLSGDWDITHRFDGQLLEREIEFQLAFQGPKQSQFGIVPQQRVRYWRDAIFDEHSIVLHGNFRPFADLQLGAYMLSGRQLDLLAERTGRRTMVGAWGNVNLGRGFNAEWELDRQRLRRGGDTAFDATVADLRMGWQLDPRQRVRLTLQGSQLQRLDDLVDRNYAAQVVYSYKVNPRTALYAGASYGAFMDEDKQELFGSTRSVFVKLSYGWQPQF